MENLYKLKEEFLSVWSEEKVKQMTLEEYTNLDRENSFCYWLESRTTDLGSIWGGSAYKFGVYKRSDISKTVDAENRKTDGEYAWFTKYGETKEEAFEEIKEIILIIIDCVKTNHFSRIDKIDLGTAYKWKIAFLYSDFTIINIFKYEILKYLASNRGFNFNKKSSVSELQNFLLGFKLPEEDYFTFTHNLWREYEDSNKKEIKASSMRKQLFINWLALNSLNSEIANDLEDLSEEVLSNGYFDKFIYDCVEYYDVYQLQFQKPISENWNDLYFYYYMYSLEQIKKDTGIDLSLNYAIVTVNNTSEYDYFIKNSVWKGDNKNVYDSYLNKFEKGSKIAIYKWDNNQIKIGALGTVLFNPKNGFELKVKWNDDFEKFHVKINSDPSRLDFYQIEQEKGNYAIEDIKNIFYKVITNIDSMRRPLNQILFGAPGTSKTYNTKKIAVEIIDNIDYSDSNRRDILNRYDQLYNLGQINFTTFHQSISYEDFVEGIKPVLNYSNDENEDLENKKGSIDYEIKDGIFKRLCNTAKGISGNINSNQIIDFQNKNFYKMSLGGKHRLDIHNWSIENNTIFLGWGGENDFSHLNDIKEWRQFREQFKKEFPVLVEDSKYVIQAVFIFQNMQIGDIVIVSKGNKIIDAIGIIESDYFYDDTKEIEVFHYRKVKWLATNMNATPELFVSKGISQQTIYQFYDRDIKYDSFIEFFNKPAKDIEHKRYVLIIDEINRGNVSSIFGELITLIETEKRKGIKEYNPECIEVELPYSNDKFSVPDNLYIIGTMNTADRSVEALDTALRRRFSFIEMPSKPDLLISEHISKGIINYSEGKEIDLILLLKTINERIELLIDKDHQIGHSFFINTKSFDDLKLVFKDSIIPLLEEYFFGDFGKIGLVIGGEFIKQKSTKPKFPSNFKYGEDNDLSNFVDKIVYEFTFNENWTADTFISIYQ